MRLLLTCGVLVLSTATISGAQTISNSCGLMVMAHGGSEEWDTAVRDAIEPLHEQMPTTIAFGMANPSTLKDAIKELEKQNVNCIAVVRLFMSAHSFLHQTQYLLALREDPPPFFISHHGHSHDHTPPVPIEYRARLKISDTALLDAPEMGEILVQNAIALTDSSRMESVLIIAHGAGDDAVNDEWMRKLDHLSDTVRKTGLFRNVAVHSLREDWEEKRVNAEAEIRRFVEMNSENGGRVIVLPFRLYGFGPYAEVLDGLSYKSEGIGLLPNPEITTWIERIANELIASFDEASES